MALVLNDRVKETTTTTGTGTINLGGAATGFETFVAGIGNSNTTYYCIAGQGTAEFEVGIGTVTDASPDTLSRTTILSSSNSDSAVNFSAGTKDVFCTLPASKTIREVDTALNVPTGTTAQRAGSPAAGDLRFNTTTSKFEGYSGSAWGDIGVGNFLVTNTFTGDGSDTTFTISNAVADENNLLVFIDGVFQAQNVYSISGTTLTFATAPANGRVITVYSALNNIQGANVVKATMTGDNSDTTLALGVTPISENAVQVYFDGVYQNKDSFSISGETLTFGVAPPTGVAVEAITLTVTDLAAAASSILVDEFTGDGSDTTFTLSAAPANENNTQVFVGGVYQEKATYSISGTTLTFSEAPANTVSIEVVSVAVGQINSAIQLSDADGDTKVMVEESADEDKIRFDTAGSERVIIDNAGKVGIGESTPLGNLHVKSGESSGSADANADELVIEGAGNHGVQLLGPNNSYMQLLFGDNDDSDVGYLFYNHSDNSLGFGVNAAERMRITSAGNVGIGLTAPANLLQVKTTVDGSGLTIQRSSTSAGTYGQLSFINTTTDNYTAPTWIRAYRNAAGVNAGEMTFGTGGTERMRIRGTNGDILLCKTVDTFSTAGIRIQQSTGRSLHTVSGDNVMDLNRTTSHGVILGFYLNGSSVGTVSTNANSLPSDRNFKRDISDLNLGLDLVTKLKPSQYNYKIDSEDCPKMYGLIAQDLEESLAEVGIEKNSTWLLQHEPKDDVNQSDYALDYQKLTPILIKAIQELSAKVEELEGKIE